MSVKLRLTRMGRKKRPFYRIVATDSRARRDGKYLEKIGTYNPLTRPAEIEINKELALKWLERGAQPSQTVRNFLSKQGILFEYDLRKRGLNEEEIALEYKKWEALQAERKKKEEAVAAMKKREEEKKAAEEAKAKAKEEAAKAAKEEAEKAAEEDAEAEAEEKAKAEGEDKAKADAETTPVQDAEKEPAEEAKEGDADSGSKAEANETTEEEEKPAE